MLSVEQPASLLADLESVAFESQQFLEHGFSAEEELSEYGSRHEIDLRRRLGIVAGFTKSQRQINPSLPIDDDLVAFTGVALVHPSRQIFEAHLVAMQGMVGALRDHLCDGYTEPLPKSFLCSELQISSKTLKNRMLTNQLVVHPDDHPEKRPRIQKVRVCKGSLLDYEIFNETERRKRLDAHLRARDRAKSGTKTGISPKDGS